MSVIVICVEKNHSKIILWSLYKQAKKYCKIFKTPILYYFEILFSKQPSSHWLH